MALDEDGRLTVVAVAHGARFLPGGGKNEWPAGTSLGDRPLLSSLLNLGARFVRL
jgi:hypothetical protein